MPDHVEAVVRMARHEGGWRIEVRETTPHRPGSRAFAATEAHDIDMALRMAEPYLACLAEPDPLLALIESRPQPKSWRELFASGDRPIPGE